MAVQTIVEPVVYATNIPIKVYSLSSLADGDTLVYDVNGSSGNATPPNAWWINNVSDATKITVSYSAGTFTFALDAATSPSDKLFIITKATIQ